MPSLRVAVRRVVVLCVVLAGAVAPARGQGMLALLEQAGAAEEAGRYREAGELYLRAFARSGGDVVLPYVAARSFARAGDADRAFAQLRIVVAGGWPHVERTRGDSLLASLRSDPRWAPLLAEAEARQARFDMALRDELLRLAEQDQRNRAGIGEVIARHGRNSPQADSALAAMAAADRPVQERLRRIVAERGWPDRRLVADDGAHAAWLVVQHADSAYQREVLPRVLRAAAEGHARPGDAAYLEDRVLANAGRPQRYGTQLGWDPATGRPVLHPVEAEPDVDRRRAAALLEPLAEYLRAQGIEYRAPH